MRLIKCLFCILAFFTSPVILPSSATAQNYSQLFRDFRSQDLSFDERRYLQTALAYEGHYFGLLDGDWGRLSREAMSRYSWANFGSKTEEWHIALLALRFFNVFDTQGWNMQYLSDLNLSVMVPTKQLVSDLPSNNLANFRHEISSLALSVGAVEIKTANGFHRYTLNLHEIGGEPYSVRKQNFAISTGEKADGTKVYTRSNFVNGKWSTIMISAQRADVNLLSTVSSSISVGRAKEIFLPVDGKLFYLIRQTLETLEQEETESAEVAAVIPSQDHSQPKVTGNAGSGFIVSENGHVLTNAHVLTGCSNVLVDGAPARIVASSDDFDLAIVQTDAMAEKSVAVFSAASARLNSDVTAVGFPYAGLLGGLNVTRGAVSSLTGLKGDITKMQFTAPVQTGNSGGPLLAANGNIVGVVVSKLDSEHVAEVMGDVPQNVNFAIRGEIAKLFLSQHAISPKLSLDTMRMKPEDLAQKASEFTTFIECD